MKHNDLRYKDLNDKYFSFARFVKLFFIALYFVFHSFSKAQVPVSKVWWDSTIYSNTRTYPLGLSLGGNFGLGYTGWDRRDSRSAPDFLAPYLYGYMRGQARVQTSGVVNSADMRLEVFPVSFFGLTMGKNISTRSADFSGVSCSNYLCQGTVERNYFSGFMVVGAAGVSLAALYRYDDMSAASVAGSSFGGVGFYDEYSSIRGASMNDQLKNLDLVAMYRWRPDSGHQLGALYTTSQFVISGEKSKALYGMWIYSFNKYTVQLGAGAYESTFQKWGPSVLRDSSGFPKKAHPFFNLWWWCFATCTVTTGADLLG